METWSSSGIQEEEGENEKFRRVELQSTCESAMSPTNKRVLSGANRATEKFNADDLWGEERANGLCGRDNLHKFLASPVGKEQGAPWFDCLAASIKFPESKISFKFVENDMYINAQEWGSSIPLVNDKAFDKSIQSSISTTMIFVKDSLSDANKTQINESGMHEHLELFKFLNQFQDVFIEDIPGELPPKQGDDDHAIEPLQGSSPPNKPPYRVSQAQQEEIMKQVNKLVEKGMDLKLFRFLVSFCRDSSSDLVLDCDWLAVQVAVSKIVWFWLVVQVLDCDWLAVQVAKLSGSAFRLLFLVQQYRLLSQEVSGFWLETAVTASGLIKHSQSLIQELMTRIAQEEKKMQVQPKQVIWAESEVEEEEEDEDDDEDEDGKEVDNDDDDGNDGDGFSWTAPLVSGVDPGKPSKDPSASKSRKSQV
ncbi:hypothetical protein L7F22_018103 [Adiantum nelumboides]|nr:hypothetical protein [Adiantum nelumboides]